MSSTHRWLTVLFACAITNAGAATQPTGSTLFNRIDVPGATFTMAHGINDRGDIVGMYEDATGHRGFLRTRGGFTRIDVLNSQLTIAFGINNRRQIVGFYRDAQAVTHGFIWENGTFTTVDAPGYGSTVALGINARGQVVGFVEEQSEVGPNHGFVWTRGEFAFFSIPGAASTSLLGIGPGGQVVGTAYIPATGRSRAFIKDADALTDIEIPGADIVNPWTINARGEVAGAFQAGVEAKGFIWTMTGVTSLEVPGSRDTRAHGINARGIVVGSFTDQQGAVHGFVARRIARTGGQS